MKNWREIPHLFVNGKFYIRIGSLEHTFDMVEYHHESQRFLAHIENRWFDLSLCTLIARSISDMSDEELIESFKSYNFDYELTSIKWNEEGYFTIKTGGGSPYFVQYLYPDKFRFQLVLNLIDKGVYPFDQNNPKDVIWRYENENT